MVASAHSVIMRFFLLLAAPMTTAAHTMPSDDDSSLIQVALNASRYSGQPVRSPGSIKSLMELESEDLENKRHEEEGRVLFGINRNPVKLARDLALISGDPTDRNKLGDNVLANMGWVRKRRIQVKTKESIDNARVYGKNCQDSFCDYCALVFAYTDDLQDADDDLDDALVSFCGFHDVHRGFYNEARGYVDHPDMVATLGRLNHKNCGRVIVSGHSLGGAVASLFAACANKAIRPPKYDMFDGMSKQSMLVTYGAPSVSLEPLYNGLPGERFLGQRFAVTQRDLKPITVEFGTDATKALADLFNRLGYKEAYMVLLEDHRELKSLAEAEKTSEWREFMAGSSRRVMAFAPWMFSELMKQVIIIDECKNEKPCEKAKQLFADIDLWCLYHKEELTFEYDVIPTMGLARDFLHPLVPFQGLTHPRGKAEDKDGARTGVKFEKHHVLHPILAPTRAVLATIAGMIDGMGFPNHDTCCYVMGIDPEATACSKFYAQEQICPNQSPPNWR